jgi:hypothetical protein
MGLFSRRAIAHTILPRREVGRLFVSRSGTTDGLVVGEVCVVFMLHP